MSLQDQMIRQRDFSSGEADPDAIRRDDVEVLKYAVRYARNMSTTHTGALIRRPGRTLLFEESGIIMDFKPFDDIAYRVVFIDGGVRIRTQDGAVVASLSAAWTATDLDSLVFEPMDNEIFIAWPGRTKVITIAEGTLAWSIDDYEFKTGIDGGIRVPFYRFPVTSDITLKPSAVTGSITVTFSAPVLGPAHVGAIFRYAGRQFRITAYSSPTVATAMVIEQLPPTYNITVGSGAGFSVGQTIETDTTNVKGEIIAVLGNVVTVVATDKLTVPTTGERLISPSASSAISGVAVAATPGATVQWDEQFASEYRGWPRSIAKDRQRLIMSNFPQFKSAIAWSATGDNRDFLIGGDPDDAMLEYITEECQVFHVVGGYDEFVVTDRGVFYVPISVGTPLQPGSVEFRPIFSSELANIRPIQVTEGLIFVDKSRTGIYAVSATGQTARPYISNEVNRLHRHLFDDVKSIAVSSGTSVFPSRQIYAVNEDGSVVVGQFNPDRDYIGWLRWEGDGLVKSITGNYGTVICMSVYTFDGDEFGVAEMLDYDKLCDCAQTFSTTSFANFLELNDGSPLKLDNGGNLDLAGITTGFYAGKTVELFAGGFFFGEVLIPEDGVITGFDEYGSITIGVGFSWVMRPLFTNVEGGQAVGQGEKRRKIEKMVATVRQTQEFQIGNRLFGSYRGGEDMSLPVPKRDDTYRYRETGRSYDPVVEFSSTFPCAFKLIELATRITL